MQEISLNILDIAQNSIAAKADLILISIDENIVENLITVVIEDNGKGMTEKQLESVVSPFYTTRTTRKVGLGIPFYKMAAEMTGGSFSISSKVGEGTVVSAEFNTNHIDCMPLGDINETICSLIYLNPTIDFIYRLSVNKNSFELNTQELRQILQEVPLNTPEVNQFIRSYLEENSAEVRS